MERPHKLEPTCPCLTLYNKGKRLSNSQQKKQKKQKDPLTFSKQMV